MSEARIVFKEMGTTPNDFTRTLPNAVGERIVTRQGLSFVVESERFPQQRVAIELTPQPDRCIASIRLPVTHVELRFDGFDDGQQQAFLERFDLYFHKGGG